MKKFIQHGAGVRALIAALALIGCKDKTSNSSPTGAGGPPVITAGPRADAGGSPQPPGSDRPSPGDRLWTMDVKALTLPDTPAIGRISGQEFKPDKVLFEHDQLTFRQGKDFFADKEVKIWLNGDFESLEGMKIEVKPDKSFNFNRPHIHMGVKKPGQSFADTQMFMDGYAMKLELGKVEGGKLSGRVHLCLSDADKSYLAGAFTVDAKSIGFSRIVGKITFPAGAKEMRITAGYAGQSTTGEPASGFVGTSVVPSGGNGFVSSFASKLEMTKDGVSFRHNRIPAGMYLVFIGWDKCALAWKWVEVKDRSEAKVDLAVEAGGFGDLEVTLPADAKVRQVNLLPLDADGKLPAGAGAAERLAMQLGNYVNGAAAQAAAGQDKIRFTGLRPGAYRVVAGKLSGDSVIKIGMKATVKLSAPEK